MTRVPPDRLPPHSGDAERGVLGCILLSPRAGVDNALESLQGFDTPFYDVRNGLIYGLIKEMLEQNHAVDLVTLVSRLESSGDLVKIGGFEYLSSLMDGVASPANLPDYLRIVREKALLRKAIATCTRGVQKAYESESGADTVIHDIESEVLAIRHTLPGKKARTTRELAMDVVGVMEDRMNRKSGLTTGFYDLDKWTNGGIQPGEMWVIAGRPSMGKTALGMDIGRNVAEGFLRNGRPNTVLVFSLEMTAEAITERLVAGIARVNTRMDRMPEESEMGRIMEAVDQVAKLPIVIDDCSGIPMSVIKSRARAYFQRFHVGLFILDYLQLVPSESGAGASDRRVSVDQVSAGVKDMAKELGVPWIALCQLNRLLERDKARKPKLSDLRESGAIEQDADLVGMLYQKDEKEELNQEPTKEITLLLAKQRNGPRNKDIPLLFHGEYTRFESATIKEQDIPQ